MNKLSFDAVVLTAIPVERQAIRAHLSNIWEERHPSGTIYEHGIFKQKHLQLHIVLGETGKGNISSAIETERAITHFKPALIFFVGVAGGLRDVKLGDVVVANKIYGYETGAADISFQPRPEIGLVSHDLEMLARIEAAKEDWLQFIKGVAPKPTPSVIVGPIASGETVVRSTRSTIFKHVKSYFGDAMAVETEGLGFLKATHAHQPIKALVIRAISDMIDGKSIIDASNFQAIAAQHASAFMFHLLIKYKT